MYDRKCLRTTFGTLLEKTGPDLRDAQKLMGHSSVELTTRFYSRARIVQLQSDASAIGEALTRAGHEQGRTNGNNAEQHETNRRGATGA